MSLCDHHNIPSHCAVCAETQNPPSLKVFDRIYHRNTHRQRYGQMFSNMFLLNDACCPGLFFESNEWKSRELIRQWLVDNQYTQQLPPLRNDVYKDFYEAIV